MKSKSKLLFFLFFFSLASLCQFGFNVSTKTCFVTFGPDECCVCTSLPVEAFEKSPDKYIIKDIIKKKITEIYTNTTKPKSAFTLKNEVTNKVNDESLRSFTRFGIFT